MRIAALVSLTRLLRFSRRLLAETLFSDQSAIVRDWPRYACGADTSRTPPSSDKQEAHQLSQPGGRRSGFQGVVFEDVCSEMRVRLDGGFLA